MVDDHLTIFFLFLNLMMHKCAKKFLIYFFKYLIFWNVTINY